MAYNDIGMKLEQLVFFHKRIRLSSVNVKIQEMSTDIGVSPIKYVLYFNSFTTFNYIII